MRQTQLLRPCVRGTLIAISLVGSAGLGAAEKTQGTYVLIDVPDAWFTRPEAINPGGQIVGTYGDANYALHGFLRDRSGTTVPIDGPDAVIEPGYGTFATGINPSGDITGYFLSAESGGQAFIRSRNGEFTLVDGDQSGTPRPVAINPGGVITGAWGDHGFVRSSDGTVTLFDSPGSTRTRPTGINPVGQVVGTAWLGTGTILTQAFIREPDGSTVLFGVDGAIANGGQAISPDGTVAGAYSGICSNHTCGFVRTPDGEITPFNVLEPRVETVPGGITPSGHIAGAYESESRFAVFVRSPDGTFDSYPFPEGLDPAYVEVTDVNPAGQVVGYYLPRGGSHGAYGFLLHTRDGEQGVEGPGQSGGGNRLAVQDR